MKKGEMHFQEITINLAGTTGTRADYFEAKSPRSVVLAPGAMFAKESWHSLAEHFQDLGVSSLALNSGSSTDLLNAVAFLKTRGDNKITMIGASAGGAGVLYTLQDSIDPSIDSVILLAPAGGRPIRNSQIRKLFIVAEHDKISPNTAVHELYRDSADPKIYKEIMGSPEHAQHLFKGRHREDIIKLISDFIVD